MSQIKTIIVTGANRGIGKAICNLLLSRPTTDQQPIRLIAASRSGEDLGFSASAQRSDVGHSVVYRKLDIANRRSVAEFTDAVVEAEHQVDVLINNAGVNLDAEYSYANAKKTLDVNYWGTLDLTQSLLPFLPPEGRIVSLSSVASSLAPYSETIQARFRNPSATLSDLDALASDYLTSIQTSTEETSGFSHPGRSYNISKALLNSATRILAAQNPHVKVNCCCPGWIRTDMGGLVGSGKVKPPKTPEEGARIPVRLAVGEIGGLSGRYWANESVRGRGDGEVREW